MNSTRNWFVLVLVFFLVALSCAKGPGNLTTFARFAQVMPPRQEQPQPQEQRPPKVGQRQLQSRGRSKQNRTATNPSTDDSGPGRQYRRVPSG